MKEAVHQSLTERQCDVVDGASASNHRQATHPWANGRPTSREMPRGANPGTWLSTFCGGWHGGTKSLVSCTYLGGQDRWSPQVVTTGDERMEFSTDDQIAQVAA